MSFLDLLKDPKLREKAAREQAKRRERNSHVTNRHPAQAKYLYGLARERLVLEQLEGLGKIRRYGNLRKLARNSLAEGYALQGRFQEASEVADPQFAKEYAAKAEAVTHLGEKRCACPDVTVKPSKVDAKGKREPTRQPIEEVFDGKRLITLLRCQQCGTLSAEAK